MSRTRTTVLFGVIGLGLLVACAENEPAMTPASGVAPRYTAHETVNVIASDRCDYAQRCGAIGGGEDATYANSSECKQALLADLSKRFAGNCENGVAFSALQACRDEIQNEDCDGVSGVIDSLDRSLACRPSKLCLD